MFREATGNEEVEPDDQSRIEVGEGEAQKRAEGEFASGFIGCSIGLRGALLTGDDSTGVPQAAVSGDDVW
eukprot:CAMPEP_0170505646 /NCGR_PEP_ID=MMETSP0208-20121228/51717_1 /TAXON_ID=197538 /ORGANISM="Strombidium inclinatum, Strain S3" /LENGTH=69 /DNA_ID=CAMNT_0010786655 /DNA_START=242 /DNA_END=448 /DNA_ORIENTATION=+